MLQSPLVPAALHVVADRVAHSSIVVLYLGRVVETAPSPSCSTARCPPYSASLISAVSGLDATAAKQRIVLSGEVPSGPTRPPARRPAAASRCAAAAAPPAEIALGHRVACQFPSSADVCLTDTLMVWQSHAHARVR
jgi:peptide/nickel transport system ATP-binding protein